MYMNVIINILMYLVCLFIIYHLFYLLREKQNSYASKKIKKTLIGKHINSEIHFLTFWNNNPVHKQRVTQKIKDLHNSKIRIIKEIKVSKQHITSLFKNVRSGGKHSKHDIDIFIIEVPKIYKIRGTHDKPNGEKVNDIMYTLKKAARGNYKNYKIAHGSFNRKEANHFFKKYFNFLGRFNNYEEVKSTLNNSNIFWLYDRITYNLFGKEKGDIDLVVDSIPAMCFLLRTITISNKFHLVINNKKKLIDLQDIASDYYPKKWLQYIKNKKLYSYIDNIPVPDVKNRFMLGLYHMYVHKNGKQSEKRIQELYNLSNQLGYTNIDIVILWNFMNTHNYKITKPLHKSSGFYIHILTRGGKNKYVYKYNNKIYYLYQNKHIYNKDKYVLLKLEKHNFTPKILYSNDNSLVLQITDVGNTLNKIIVSKMNSINFKEQISHMEQTLQQNNIVHNDLNYHNITLKDHKLYLIDFEHSILNNDTDTRIHSNAIYCKHFPKFDDEINFHDYLKKNTCFNYT